MFSFHSTLFLVILFFCLFYFVLLETQYLQKTDIGKIIEMVKNQQLESPATNLVTYTLQVRRKYLWKTA